MCVNFRFNVNNCVVTFLLCINRTGLYPEFYPDEMCRPSTKLTQHNPPLLYNLNHDPGELNPLNATLSPYKEIVEEIDKVSSCNRKFTFVHENRCSPCRHLVITWASYLQWTQSNNYFIGSMTGHSKYLGGCKYSINLNTPSLCVMSTNLIQTLWDY